MTDGKEFAGEHMEHTILVVDDEQLIRELIADYLEDEGYEVMQAADGAEAVRLLRQRAVDLVVLDVMMPGKNGFEVCEDIRSFSNAVIVMLTAKAEEEDKLTGYGSGADDYVTKPFSPKVLAAKIRVLLQRWSHAEPASGAEETGFVIDEAAYEVRVNGSVLPLTTKEFELLRCLSQHPNQALTRDNILDKVWGMDYFGDVRTVDTHIKRLRRKLGEHAEHIVTVRGNGYKYR
ncbi:response regulator transcription factor [Paenibacillus sp. MER TA 81-3]|uniref:response regulator transcription factor n=1 Tax=Paenibacillus sp. MER TA 81-3 TaxID=2939573 RepID=UPI00203CB2AA|nr:response regulator transcription factor [Paenibacillus sp. MER TA 81-3]MCM3342816.1 response regulator transcription factor [Paenibacillus sp. MER TA 81-3]